MKLSLLYMHQCSTRRWSSLHGPWSLLLGIVVLALLAAARKPAAAAQHTRTAPPGPAQHSSIDPTLLGRKQRKVQKWWQSLSRPVDRKEHSLANYILDTYPELYKGNRDALIASPISVHSLIDLWADDEPRSQDTLDRVMNVLESYSMSRHIDIDKFLAYSSMLQDHPETPFPVTDGHRLLIHPTAMNLAAWAHMAAISGASWFRHDSGHTLAEMSNGHIHQVVASHLSPYATERTKEKQLLNQIQALEAGGRVKGVSLIWYVNRDSDFLVDLLQQHDMPVANVREVPENVAEWEAPSTISRPLPHQILKLLPVSKRTRQWLMPASDIVLSDYFSHPKLIERLDQIVSDDTIGLRYQAPLEALLRQGAFGRSAYDVLGALDILHHNHDLTRLTHQLARFPMGTKEFSGVEAELRMLALLERNGHLVSTTEDYVWGAIPGLTRPTEIRDVFEIDGVIKDERGLQILEVKALGEDITHVSEKIDRAIDAAHILGLPAYYLISAFDLPESRDKLGQIGRYIEDRLGREAPFRAAYALLPPDDSFGDHMAVIEPLYEPAVLQVPTFKGASTLPPSLRLALQTKKLPHYWGTISSAAKNFARADRQRITSPGMKHDPGNANISN